MSDVAKTPREELECEKKYLYEYSMFWECNDGSKCQILEDDVVRLLNEQQATINELQSIINHIKCEEDCFDYDYCCETVCSLYNEIKHLKEENEQLKEELNNLKKDETMLYHYYTLARYGGDGV